MKRQLNGRVLNMMIMDQICCLMQAKLQERNSVICMMGLQTSARLVQNIMEDINETVDNIVSEIFPIMRR